MTGSEHNDEQEEETMLPTFDPKRTGYFHFSGFVHGDNIDILAYEDGRIVASCWNDGYPNPGGSGGYAEDIPDELLHPFQYQRFIDWLTANFWNTRPIDINSPRTEAVLRDFLRQHGADA